MKVAIIPPPSLMELADGDYHLMLPHLLDKDPYYSEFYRDQEGLKILDNGEAEGEETRPEDLFRLAAEFGAQEIVVPDTMTDSAATITQARYFEALAAQHPEFKYMAVIQGHNAKACLRSLRYFAHCDWVTRVALPRCMNQIDRHFRYNFALMYQSVFEKCFEAVHCLGASENVVEVISLKSLGFLRGIDTSMPIVLGLAGINIASYEYAPRGDEYFKTPFVSSTKYHLIKHNVDTFKQWALEESPEAVV